jgi:hypothetical protein
MILIIDDGGMFLAVAHYLAIIQNILVSSYTALPHPPPPPPPPDPLHRYHLLKD